MIPEYEQVNEYGYHVLPHEHVSYVYDLERTNEQVIVHEATLGECGVCGAPTEGERTCTACGAVAIGRINANSMYGLMWLVHDEVHLWHAESEAREAEYERHRAHAPEDGLFPDLDECPKCGLARLFDNHGAKRRERLSMQIHAREAINGALQRQVAVAVASATGMHVIIQA